jgi:hypothetical protein
MPLKSCFKRAAGMHPPIPYAPAFTVAYLSGQQHGDGVADLFSEQASSGSALLQFRMKNLDQMLKPLIAERPAVHKIYDSPRKSSFR